MKLYSSMNKLSNFGRNVDLHDFHNNDKSNIGKVQSHRNDWNIWRAEIPIRTYMHMSQLIGTGLQSI